MNLPLVQQIGRLSPWRESPLFALCPLQKRVKIGSVASVFPPAPVPGKKSGMAEFIQCALDRRAGELQIGGNGIDGRPTTAFRICAVFEIDIHRLCTVVQVRLIDVRKVRHGRHLLSGANFTGFPGIRGDLSFHSIFHFLGRCFFLFIRFVLLW